MENISKVLISVLVISFATMFVLNAYGEEYAFVNSLPAYLEIEQGDTVKLTNLNNSTINMNQEAVGTSNHPTNKQLYSFPIGANSTWIGDFPYPPNTYDWYTDTDSGQIVIKDDVIPVVTTVNINDNIITGNSAPDSIVAVTTISPSMETSNKIVKTDSSGDFETNLNPTEKGSHDIYVTYGDSTVKTIYTVEDENENLEIRLSILQVLESILKIIFGR